MRVLLLGATGFLGDYLAARLPQSFTTYAAPRGGRPAGTHVVWTSHRLDAADDDTIEPVLEEASPDVIVNAVAVTSLPPDAGDRRLRTVNAEFPHKLASHAKGHRARVVQVSTDAVFSGKRGPYAETDRPDPVDAYGRSKLDGELGPPHLTIRTSFFGRTPRGIGLVEWLIGNQRETVEGYNDYRFSGLSALLLAEFVALALGAPTPLEGVYHVGGEAVTKYELLRETALRLGLPVRVVPVDRGRVDRALDSSRFFAAIGRRPPTLAESLATLVPCGAP